MSLYERMWMVSYCQSKWDNKIYCRKSAKTGKWVLSLSNKISHVWGVDIKKKKPILNIVQKEVKDMGGESFDKRRIDREVYKS